jgi:uncharacterized protein YciI
MAKGAYVTPRIKELLAQIYIGNRSIRSTEAHRLLLQKMKAEGLDEIFGPNFPGISTVSKELKSLRQKDEARSPQSQGLDAPWTIGSVGPLLKYPIPPDAMPVVMAISTKSREISERQGPHYKVLTPLTIRQAQWIARLYKIIDDPDLLWAWALEYANAEWISEVTNKSFDSTKLDLELIRNPQCLAEVVKLKKEGMLVVRLRRTNEEVAKKYKKEAQDERKHKAKKQK